MFRDYSPVLTDCTAEPIGYGLPRSNYDASLLLIQTLFGSVIEFARVHRGCRCAFARTTMKRARYRSGNVRSKSGSEWAP